MHLCNLKKEMQESILKGPVSPLPFFFSVKYVSKSNFFSNFLMFYKIIGYKKKIISLKPLTILLGQKLNNIFSLLLCLD